MMPSYFPPVGWVSRWLPMAMGGRLLSLPGRRAKILPISSMVTVQPAASQAAINQRAHLGVQLGQRQPLDAALGRSADLRGIHDRIPQAGGIDRRLVRRLIGGIHEEWSFASFAPGQGLKRSASVLFAKKNQKTLIRRRPAAGCWDAPSRSRKASLSRPACMVMQPSTGQTWEHRLQPTHSSSITS